MVVFRDRGIGKSLTMTYFPELVGSVSLALPCFTVLFGMGRGGAKALWSSDSKLVWGWFVLVWGGGGVWGYGVIAIGSSRLGD